VSRHAARTIPHSSPSRSADPGGTPRALLTKQQPPLGSPNIIVVRRADRPRPAAARCRGTARRRVGQCPPGRRRHGRRRHRRGPRGRQGAHVRRGRAHRRRLVRIRPAPGRARDSRQCLGSNGGFSWEADFGTDVAHGRLAPMSDVLGRLGGAPKRTFTTRSFPRFISDDSNDCETARTEINDRTRAQALGGHRTTAQAQARRGEKGAAGSSFRPTVEVGLTRSLRMVAAGASRAADLPSAVPAYGQGAGRTLRPNQRTSPGSPIASHLCPESVPARFVDHIRVVEMFDQR